MFRIEPKKASNKYWKTKSMTYKREKKVKQMFILSNCATDKHIEGGNLTCREIQVKPQFEPLLYLSRIIRPQCRSTLKEQISNSNQHVANYWGRCEKFQRIHLDNRCEKRSSNNFSMVKGNLRNHVPHRN